MMMDLLQEPGGSRMHYNFPRVGASSDLPHGFAQRARAKVSSSSTGSRSTALESTIFFVRTQGVGYSKAEEMVNHGVTGPNLRAGGVNYDVRTSHPYSVYSELDWEVPVERPSVKGADCYDRYRIRVEEMRVSAMMVLRPWTRWRAGRTPTTSPATPPSSPRHPAGPRGPRATPLRGQPRRVDVLPVRGRRG